MKFAAAAMTPGLAKVCQNGTEPSAKSTQIVPFSRIPQVSAAARCGAAANPAHTANMMSSSLFTRPCPKVAAQEVTSTSRAVFRLLAVERRVDLGYLFGLGRLVRLRVAVGRLRPAAEVEAEAGEVDPVASVGADLLERGQQGLALVGLLRHLLGRPDLDVAVLLQAGGGRDQLADDHVLLQAQQPVDLALDRRVRQHLRRLLEGGSREERLGGQRGLRDPEDQRLVGRLLLLALLLLHARVLALEDYAVDELAGQEVGVARLLDANLLQHLPDDQLDVLVVDVHALGAVDLLHLGDEVQLGLGPAPDPEDLRRVPRALVPPGAH